MSMPIANDQAALSTNSAFCAISTWAPTTTQQGAGQFSCQLIKDVSYYILNSTATGTVTFQEQGADGTWRNLAAPAAITLAGNPFNGTIPGVFHGVRIVVSSLAVSTIDYAELKGVVVSYH
jgi:hypothetical protein